MDKLWIISLILSTAHEIYGQFDVKVELITKKYVELGSSTTLYCRHNADLDYLYKVTWLRGSENKIFEYIRDRDPPFLNFSVLGAEIDLIKSNESHVTLTNLDFDAADTYYCEVSIDNPIFTKPSNETTIHVITKQLHPPKIQFPKRYFVVGDEFVANCTTSRSKPHPHITWLINGKKVDASHTTVLHPRNSKYNRSKIHHTNSQPPMEFSYGKISNAAQDFRDYESPTSTALNETEFQSYYPSVRSSGGQHYPSKQSFFHLQQHQHRDRSRSSSSYGNIITHSDRVPLPVEYFNEREYQQRPPEQVSNFYDNKYHELLPLRGGSLNKIRRHLKTVGNNNNNLNYDQSTTSSLSSSTRAVKDSINRIRYRPTHSSSELRIRVSELHADANGRLEISCVSTIPAEVDRNEEFADFRIFKVRVDIKTVNPPTTEQAQTFESKTAALGGTGQRSTTSAGVKNFNFNVRHLATFLFVDFLLFSINVNMQKISIL